jgi:hypothetical protein
VTRDLKLVFGSLLIWSFVGVVHSVALCLRVARVLGLRGNA